MSKTVNGIKSLGKSFTYAFKGIIYCINNERNMRIHFVAAGLVLLFSFFYRVTTTECLFLVLCIGLVITAETVNTSIETLVNLQSPSYNNLARIAKDVAAGAVLVASIISLVIGIIVFCDIQRLAGAFNRILSSWVAILLFLAAISAGTVFVFIKPKPLPQNYIKIYKINGKK